MHKYDELDIISDITLVLLKFLLKDTATHRRSQNWSILISRVYPHAGNTYPVS